MNEQLTDNQTQFADQAPFYQPAAQSGQAPMAETDLLKPRRARQFKLLMVLIALVVISLGLLMLFLGGGNGQPTGSSNDQPSPTPTQTELSVPSQSLQAAQQELKASDPTQPVVNFPLIDPEISTQQPRR